MPDSIEVWLEEITQETELLFHHLDLYKKLSRIIAKNKSLKGMDTTLLQWMRGSFTVDLVIGIGRICDDDKRTRSLVRFLFELKKRDGYLGRERYIGLYKNFKGDVSASDYIKRLANEHFDKLAGLGSSRYPKAKVEKDIVRLTKKKPFKEIIVYRNSYIAHMSKKKQPKSPTYRDLFKAFRIIEGIMKKYNLLIKAASFSQLTPTIQGDWAKVLTIPWISREG